MEILRLDHEHIELTTCSWEPQAHACREETEEHLFTIGTSRIAIVELKSEIFNFMERFLAHIGDLYPYVSLGRPIRNHMDLISKPFQ